MRQSGCLQWPKESPWLVEQLKACAVTVGTMWRRCAVTAEVVARADWVNGLLSTDDWSLLAPTAAEPAVVEHLVAGYRDALADMARGLPDDRKRHFCEWFATCGGAAPVAREGQGPPAARGDGE